MQTVSRRRFLEGSATGVAATGLGVSSLCAQDWARQAVDKSPRRREWVTVKHGGRSVESVVAYPQSQDKAPAIVVIHEIFGMTDWVENVADEFAQAGYLAIAPDLLSGMAPNGGTHEGPSGQRSGTGHPQTAARPDHRGSQRCGRLLQEAPRLQREGLRGWLLMGRRTVVPLRHQPQRSVGGVRLLWQRPGRGCDPQHTGSGLSVSTRGTTRASTPPSPRPRSR